MENEMNIEPTMNTGSVVRSENTARDKILLFVIGVLVGAVVSTAAFFVYVKVLGVSANNTGQSGQMQGGTPPEMPSGGSSQGQPPEMPSGGNSQGSQGTPPEMPGNNSSQNTNS